VKTEGKKMIFNGNVARCEEEMVSGESNRMNRDSKELERRKKQ